MKEVTTIGNHSYIPLDSYNLWGEEVEIFLKTLQKFEENNPGLEVLSWHPKWFLSAGYVAIQGLWVTHRPKK